LFALFSAQADKLITTANTDIKAIRRLFFIVLRLNSISVDFY